MGAATVLLAFLSGILLVVSSNLFTTALALFGAFFSLMWVIHELNTAYWKGISFATKIFSVDFDAIKDLYAQAQKNLGQKNKE